MSKSMSYMEQINLQTEIGILQEKILAFKPCYAKIKVPSIMGDNEDGFIETPMPLHLSITYGDTVIPKGTRFIVQAVSGNYNDIRIIGFYDNPKGFDFASFLQQFVNTTQDKEPISALPDDYGTFPYKEV